MDLIAEKADAAAVNEISVFITTHGNVPVNSNKPKRVKTNHNHNHNIKY